MPPSWPGPRYEVALAYDSARAKVVMFGGASGSFYLHELWEWDGATGTWSDRTPVSIIPGTWPPGRGMMAMAYDERRKKVVMYGGGTGTARHDLWEWDGSARVWADRTPPVLSAAWPSARMAPAMAYDKDRGKMFLFGGVRGLVGAMRDAWEWDGGTGTFSARSPSPFPPSWPTERAAHAMAYDEDRRRVVMFAGGIVPTSDCDVPNAEVWEWNGEMGTFTDRTPRPMPAAVSWPPPRRFHAMAYDASRRAVVMFSGLGAGAGGVFGDAWEWHGELGSWLKWDSMTPWPASRYGHGMAFDPARRRGILCGARATFDTWEWSVP